MTTKFLTSQIIKRTQHTALACSMLLISTFSLAETVLLDRIVAIVDDDVVMESELDNRIIQVASQLQENGTPLPPAEKLTQQVLDRLILESIQLQLAEKVGVRVNDQTLNNTMASIAKQNNMSLAKFQSELIKDGTNYQDAREQIRTEMLITRVRQNQIRNRVDITEQEADAFLESDLGQAQLSVEYHLGHILVPMPDQASPEQIQVVEQYAIQLHQRLQQGANFEQLAVADSAGDQALEGGDLGWRNRAQLPSLFAEVVPEMRIGDVSQPIHNSSGYHLVKLLNKRGAGTHVVAQAHVRHILIKPSEIRSDDEARQQVQSLYKKINAGAVFEDLARIYSEDPGSKVSGGDLDWIDPNDMVPSFRDTIANTNVGILSQPFRTNYGWHILEVLGKRDYDMSSEFQLSEARNVLHDREFEEELQNWLREIRENAYVEIKI